MLVPDEVRKCVVFVCSKRGEKMRLDGTAFFVGISAEGIQDANFFYLVTAAHVINGIRAKSSDQIVYLRMNFKDSGAQFVETRIDDWVVHDEADAAALVFRPPVDVVDYKVYPLDRAATEEVIAKEGIGVGDEVFVTGLFASHYGRENNLPIVRIGNIALMPEEKVETRFGAIDAYLIESRSIGGLSGSPVFVHLGGTRLVGGSTRIGTSGFYLLGVMHGHWDLPTAKKDTIDDDLQRESVNMGIAIVVPASKIVELIDYPAFVERRDAAIKKHQEKTLPTLD